MPDFNPSLSKPLILNSLPNPPGFEKGCPPQTQQKIDLILLTIEALKLKGSENMLAIAKELELQDLIKNRIVLWRLRCTNPWRRSYLRRSLTIDEGKALVMIASYCARPLNVLIRDLLAAQQQMIERGLPFAHNFRLSEYLEQFRAHFKSRMNPRRAKIAAYLASDEQLEELALSLLNQLLFCTGTRGMERFWISLFDGEVA